MSKKRIVCFGDSNTWGYDPVNHTRYDEETRWTMVLQSLLGEEYQMIEEGQDYALPMIETHNPFDLLIIMLGSNDLKKKFALPAPDIAGSLQNMLMKIKGYATYQLGCPDLKILVVSPPALGEDLGHSGFAPFFDCEDAVKQSKELARWYELVAQQFGCEFLNATELVCGSEVDQLHLSPENHRKLARAMMEKIEEILR